MNRFERLANIRGDSLEEFLDSIELSRDDVFAQCERPDGPRLDLLVKVCDAVEMTIDDLVDDRIDEDWVRNPTLSARYEAAEGSRMRTSLAVIRWIEKNYGRAPTASLMRSLRIPQKTFNDPERPVRLRMLCTLLRAARARGLADSSIFEIGLGAVDIRENTGIHDQLSQHRNPQRLYECFFTEVIQRFESNYDYRIEKSDANSITLRIRPREERILENSFEVATDRTLSIYRWGVTAGLLKAIGRAPASATPLRLVDAHTRDETVRIEWNNTRHAAILMSTPTRSRAPSVSAP